jgi:FkbM family methyltransferase
LLSRFKNWRGINVDASQDAIAVFNRERAADINLHFAISDRVSDVEYSVFDHSAVNTCDSDVVNRNINSSGSRFKLERVTKMQSRTLENILDEHLPHGQEIDLLNIDVEGFDFKVLLGNNWEKYAPFLILIESIGIDFDTLHDNEIYKHLTARGYKLISHCFVTSIYRRVKKQGKKNV